MFQPLSEIVPKRINIDYENSGVDVCDLWHKYANQIFLSKILKGHEAISFRDGVLVIFVENDMFLDEIKRQESKIIKKINQEIGELKLIQVKYR